MIKAHVPGIIDGECAAKTDTAESAKGLAPYQRDVNNFQEVFIPAHGDAVFGDAAKTGQNALVQMLVNVAKIDNRLGQGIRVTGQGHGQGFEFQAVDGGNTKAFV